MTHLANFCLFCKKICHQSRETSAPGDFFILSNFVKTYQSKKGAVVLPQSSTNFCQIKSDNFFHLKTTIWRRNDLIFTRQSIGEDGRFCMMISTQDTQKKLSWRPILRSGWISKSKFCSIFTSMWLTLGRQQFFFYFSERPRLTNFAEIFGRGAKQILPVHQANKIAKFYGLLVRMWMRTLFLNLVYDHPCCQWLQSV